LRRLIVMRHAQAARAGVSGGDFDRPLTEDGKADARLIAGALSEAGLVPDLVLISSSVRTQQTWREIAKVFANADVAASRDLYNAEEGVLRQAVEEVEDRCDTLLLIAHNPGIHSFAVRLLLEGSASASVIDRVDNRFPTATAVAFLIDEAGRANYDGLFMAGELGGGGRD